ncbi:MAG: glycosyltransferase family 2 protein, partial [Peptostreptococcaceae bacterium]
NIILITDYIALIYMVILCGIFFIYVIYSSIELSKRIKANTISEYIEIDNKEYYTPVSILVPAYNEEVTICDTINSLIHIDYNEYEIIIINDGSTDESLEKIVNRYDLKPVYKPMKKNIETKEVLMVYSGVYESRKITLVDKENGGKADALNVGINYSRYPIFVAVDADSMLDKDSVKNIIAPFMENKKTIAVGGNVKISNYLSIENGEVANINKPKNMIVAFQMIEYIRSFLINRMTWDNLNMNLIISGAFGAFNKDVVIKLGGYKNNTVGEDMELVMRLHKYFLKNKEQYYIGYAPTANCYTQAPDTLKGLKTQRRRWQIGLIHSMGIHKSMFLDRKWFLAKTYFLLFEMITPIMEILGVAIITLSFIWGVINLKFLILYYLMIFVYGFGISATSILLDGYVLKEYTNKNTMKKLIFLSLLEPIGYRQMISLFRVSAFIGYRKNKHKWGSIKRNKNI